MTVMDDLTRQAEGLGIKVDARWSEATLRHKIADAQAMPAQKTPPQAVEPITQLRPVNMAPGFTPNPNDQVAPKEPAPSPQVTDTVSHSRQVNTGPGPTPPPPTPPPEPQTVVATTATQSMIPVKLLKNYRPMGEYEIVGDMAPAPFPGVKFQDKLWAGTIVKLPRDEVIRLLNNQTETVEAILDANNKVVDRKAVKRKFPLAERADDLPV